jgi:hypothetical protein
MDISKKYYLLLLDIKGSTRQALQDRQKLFETLEKEIQRLNGSLNPKPVLSLQISYGDEVAGLFDSPGNLYDAVDALRSCLFDKAEVRFVAVYGEIGVVSEDIRKIGGEIFKRADDLMRRLKRERGFCKWAAGDPFLDQLLTSLTEMSNTLLKNMTPYQHELYCRLKSGEAKTTIASTLKKHKQSVSNSVKRGGAELVLQAEETIRMTLERLDVEKQKRGRG